MGIDRRPTTNLWGKAFLFPEMADEQPGFTVDAGVMTQLLLSYLAAGCKEQVCGVGMPALQAGRWRIACLTVMSKSASVPFAQVPLPRRRINGVMNCGKLYVNHRSVF